MQEITMQQVVLVPGRVLYRGERVRFDDATINMIVNEWLKTARLEDMRTLTFSDVAESNVNQTRDVTR